MVQPRSLLVVISVGATCLALGGCSAPGLDARGPAESPSTTAEPTAPKGNSTSGPEDMPAAEAPSVAPGSGPRAGAHEVHVSVLPMSVGCPDDEILPGEGYVAAFASVLAEVGRCHASGEEENSVSVKLDPTGAVKDFEVVKGDGSCLKEALKKVRFPSYRCGATLLIVSAPGPAS